MGEGWVLGGFGAEVDLGVVGITVEVEVEVAEDLTKGEDVDEEEEWAENGTLGDTVRNCGGGGGVVVKGDEVGAVGEVGVEPPECGVFDTESLQSGQQDGVAHGIEGRTQVEEDEEGEGTSVGRGEKVIEDFEECSFCGVEWAETRLEGFKEVIGVQVSLELCSDKAFQGFGEEGEVGDGPVVTEGGGV